MARRLSLVPSWLPGLWCHRTQLYLQGRWGHISLRMQRRVESDCCTGHLRGLESAGHAQLQGSALVLRAYDCLCYCLHVPSVTIACDRCGLAHPREFCGLWKLRRLPLLRLRQPTTRSSLLCTSVSGDDGQRFQLSQPCNPRGLDAAVLACHAALSASGVVHFSRSRAVQEL